MSRELSEKHFKECFGDLPESEQEHLKNILRAIEKKIGLYGL